MTQENTQPNTDEQAGGALPDAGNDADAPADAPEPSEPSPATDAPDAGEPVSSSEQPQPGTAAAEGNAAAAPAAATTTASPEPAAEGAGSALQAPGAEEKKETVEQRQAALYTEHFQPEASSRELLRHIELFQSALLTQEKIEPEELAAAHRELGTAAHSLRRFLKKAEKVAA